MGVSAGVDFQRESNWGLSADIQCTWNFLIRTLSGPPILSFVERLSSFRGYFLWSVYSTLGLVSRSRPFPVFLYGLAGKGRLRETTLGLSFVGRFVLFRSVLYQRFHCNYSLFIGASLSEPHTRELGGEISVCMYVCLYPSDFARELQVKMFACPWQNNC